MRANIKDDQSYFIAARTYSNDVNVLLRKGESLSLEFVPPNVPWAKASLIRFHGFTFGLIGPVAQALDFRPMTPVIDNSVVFQYLAIS